MLGCVCVVARKRLTKLILNVAGYALNRIVIIAINTGRYFSSMFVCLSKQNVFPIILLYNVSHNGRDCIMCSLVVLMNSQVSQVLRNKTNDFDLLRWFSVLNIYTFTCITFGLLVNSLLFEFTPRCMRAI